MNVHEKTDSQELALYLPPTINEVLKMNSA